MTGPAARASLAAVEILSQPEADVPRPLRLQALALQDQAWPRDSPRSADPALLPISMLLVENGRVRAALDILSKPWVPY